MGKTTPTPLHQVPQPPLPNTETLESFPNNSSGCESPLELFRNVDPPLGGTGLNVLPRPSVQETNPPPPPHTNLTLPINNQTKYLLPGILDPQDTGKLSRVSELRKKFGGVEKVNEIGSYKYEKDVLASLPLHRRVPHYRNGEDNLNQEMNNLPGSTRIVFKKSDSYNLSKSTVLKTTSVEDDSSMLPVCLTARRQPVLQGVQREEERLNSCTEVKFSLPRNVIGPKITYRAAKTAIFARKSPADGL